MGQALTTLLFTLLLILPGRAPATEDLSSDEKEQTILFYGIVTVRDGEAIFVLNPELTDEEAERCASQLADKLPLGEAFDDYGRQFIWGDKEQELPDKNGMVPYLAFFITPGETSLSFVTQLAEVEITPRGGSSMECGGFVGQFHIAWWGPVTAEECTFSFIYSDSSSFQEVADLKGDEIAVSAEGTSPDGITWKITDIVEVVSREHTRIVITIETTKGPKYHQLNFWYETEKNPELCEASTHPPSSGEKLTYQVKVWAPSKEALRRLVIRERHSDRAKRFEVKGFRFEPE